MFEFFYQTKMISVASKIKTTIIIGLSFIMLGISAVFAWEKVFPRQFSNIVGYLSESGHTGLVNTPAQIAYEQEIAKEYASTVQPSGSAGPASDATVASGQRPSQLFDIAMEIDKVEIEKPSDLSTRVIFTSFGTVPTSVKMTFDVLDDLGEIMATSTDSVLIETEKVYSKSFSNLSLPAGNYTLRLTTLYNTDVKDEFYAPFSVSLATNTESISIAAWAIILFFALTLFYNIVKYIKRSKIYRKANYGKV